MGNFVTDLLTKGAKDAILEEKKRIAAGVKDVTRPAIQAAEDAVTGKGPAAAASGAATGEVRQRPTGVQPRPSAASLAAEAAPPAGAASAASFFGGVLDRVGAAVIGKERVDALKKGAAQVDTGAVMQRVQDGAKAGVAAVATAGAVVAAGAAGVAGQVVDAVTPTKEDAKTSFRQSEIRDQNATAEQARKALEAQAAGQQPVLTVQSEQQGIETSVSPSRAFGKAADPVAPPSKTQGLDQMINEASRTADTGRLETLMRARAQVAKIGEPAP